MLKKRFWQLILMAIGLALVLSGGVDIALSTAPGQSLPTRTPTPGATTPDPTATSGGGSGPTATPAPQDTPAPTDEPAPTSTPVAGTTATSVPAADDFLPTAEACSEAPTIQALNSPINVRSGPGTNYDVVATLSYLEVRLITGRAAQAAWWQIQMPDGSLAWVADEVVAVYGYTGLVPLVEAPALGDGSTPTPGPTWAPTPNPACPSPTPTMAATASATATATATATSTETAAAESAATAAPATETPATEASAEEAQTEATATEERPPTPMPTVEPDAVAEADPTAADATQPTVAGEDDEGGNLWLPAAGILLIGAAIFLFVRGRQTP